MTRDASAFRRTGENSFRILQAGLDRADRHHVHSREPETNRCEVWYTQISNDLPVDSKLDQKMYSSHELFKPPSSDAVLWRYLNFTKFVSLLEKRALFFSRVDMLGDPFEGSFSTVNVKLRPSIYPKDFQEYSDGIYDYFRQLRSSTMVNCWHENAYESAAMWKIYSKDNEGVAVKTNFSSFCECFSVDDSENVYIGRVQYVDYKKEFIPEGNTLAPFIYKRKSFEYEHEVRALVQGNAATTKDKQEFSQKYSQGGLYVNVNISTLIHEIVVAPDAKPWFLDLVKSVANQYNLKERVRTSDLDIDPVWR